MHASHIALCLKFLALIFILVFSSKARSQPLNLELEVFNTKHGLSQNQVFAIIQDNKGFIWFGTDEGLNRFDGHEFKIFRHDDNNPNSLLDNSIHALVVDDKGVIWIGSANGICRYYPENEFIERLPVNYDDPTKPKGTGVNEMVKGKDGKIWISYLGSGVDVYDPKTNEFFHYITLRDDAYRIINDYVISVMFMPDGDKLLGTREGIQFLGQDGIPLGDEETDRKYPWRTKIHSSISCFYHSADRKLLWIGTELSGVYKIDLSTGNVKNYNTDNSALKFNNNIPSIFEDSRGNVWIGAEAIYLYDDQKDILIPFDENGVRENVLNKNPVLSIFEDKDKNIWFGTFRLGVLKYNPDNTKIIHYHADQGKASITNNQVLSFAERKDGSLWIGTDGGGLFKMTENRLGFVSAPLNEKFSSQVIKCIYQDGEGNFWIGTWDGGMMKYNPEDKILESFNPDRGNFQSRHVWAILGNSNGNLWIGTLRDGLCYFSPQTKKYEYFTSREGDATSLVNNDIISLYMDSQRRLWVGTSNGLSILPDGSRNFINFSTSALNITILSIYEDNQNQIWLGTSGGGIIIMDKDLNIVKTFSEKDGLPSSTICSIESDDDQNIWISTYNGLVRIEKNSQKITEVPQIAGLQGKEFIPRSSFKTRDGKMLFGGVNGFNLFHPDSVRFSPVTNQVVFTSLKINNDYITPVSDYDGRKILEKSITEIDELHLSYKDYSFTLSFAPLSYNWQGSLHYAYFLTNLDKEWQYSSPEKRFIHYTNLDPGEHILKVKTSFDGKQWPEEATTLRIFIEPPWWGTIWFRIISILLIASLLFAVYKVRVRFMKKQQQKLERLVRIRTLELKKSNEEIQMLLGEVAEKKEQIEVQMDELKHINEEIGAQRDILEIRSSELEKAQKKLKDVNTTLEILVEKRTQKLTDALRELETFLYRASHDLRGPISSMLGLIGAIRLEKDPVQYNTMYTNFFQRSVLGLDRTLQKLLQKHTIEKKKLYPEKIQKTMLLILLEEILRDLPFYRPEDFAVSVEDDVSIETDRMLLSIVLSNLLENAFFYSDSSHDKRVFLGFENVSESIRITVEDHGSGIKTEVRDKIFTMFYRGNELSSGNGLGLYLVKNVLGKINGNIVVETEEGSFSRFIVTLPQYGSGIVNL